jgi:hypothetical protein
MVCLSRGGPQLFDPNRQDPHRFAAVGATDRRSGSGLSGRVVQVAVIPDPAETTRQHMLDQEPEKLPTGQGLDDLLTSVGFDSERDQPISV